MSGLIYFSVENTRGYPPSQFRHILLCKLWLPRSTDTLRSLTRKDAAIVPVPLLWTGCRDPILPTPNVDIGGLVLHVLSQRRKRLTRPTFQRVPVLEPLLPCVDHRHAPVYAQVHGDEDQVAFGNVHFGLLCPTPDVLVPTLDQLAVEKGVECVDGHARLGFCPFGNQVHVKVDHLVVQPGSVLERRQVLDPNLLIEFLHQNLIMGAMAVQCLLDTLGRVDRYSDAHRSRQRSPLLRNLSIPRSLFLVDLQPLVLMWMFAT